MGNTCAAYWMPPIAVIAPTMIANGGSDSKGMCSVFFFRVLFQTRFLKRQKKKKKKKKKKDERLFVCVLSECDE